VERGPGRVSVNEGLDLYQEAIVAAARRVEEHPRLAHPSASATVDNPLCGDRVTTDVAAEAGTVRRVGQRVRGCLLCEASAAVFAEIAPGADARRLALAQSTLETLLIEGTWKGGDPDFEPLSMFAPVAGFRSRHRCVLLPLEALREALAATG